MRIRPKFHPIQLIRRYQQPGDSQIAVENHASLEFEFLWSHISSFEKPYLAVSTKARANHTSLLLTSYLAHWGMFRGKASLKDTNWHFLTDLSIALLNKKNGILNPISDLNFEGIAGMEPKELERMIKSFKTWLDNHGISPTDTLLTKIVMGLLGNMPAYDRYFKNGLSELRKGKKYSGQLAFSETGLKNLSDWYAKSKYTWPKVSCFTDSNSLIPSGKVIDMAIFQYGKDMEKYRKSS